MAKSGKASQRKSALPSGTPLATSPELLEAWRKLDAGDVVTARRTAAALLATGALSESDRVSAEDLLSRTRFPKWSLAFAAGAAAIIVILIILASTRS